MPDAAMECEQTGHSKGLPSVKLQQPGPGQSKRGLQATLSQSFQPDTPEHPNDNLLHSVSASSMRSTGSGIEAQTNIQDASQPESAFARSAQPASTNQQLNQQHFIPSAASEGAEVSDDMLPEHSLAAQMSNADQLLSLAEKEAIDMLPEHSLVAQMSVDEPQPDAGEKDSVPSRTTQLPHVLDTIESGNTHADHGEKLLCHLQQSPLACDSVVFHVSAVFSCI